jgi:type I restriction enzyme R subunit
MIFERELDFEKALVDALTHKGWETTVLTNPTEEDLLKNWANILFENNREIDRLNEYPLTDGEMHQIIEQIKTAKTPLNLSGIINGRTISIKRDNPNDKNHLGKEISLKIYDRREIAAGQSRYQIARQPIFKTKSTMLNDRRGDVLLLINGMPVIHIELKRSGVPISQACYQIEKYSHEGVFTRIFSLVQIFVAMTPTETLYFANPGPEGKFNKDFYFHWADFNNEPINDWNRIAGSFLSIPMAHQLIGFYTVADDSDGILKVLRSYQYYAANAISDKVSKNHWNDNNQYGGFIWHTTGSGKTMTSFKSAQLIANSKDADKVIFLMDRIELGTQSLKAYRAFAEAFDEIQATEDTNVLIRKLKSNDPKNVLIVTSIQKMSNIKGEDSYLKENDLQIMNSKRIVFIVDEAHRSTFGDMLFTIKSTFENALFFGFTGTPIREENKKRDSTTSNIFGDELHRYSIADGIRDKNVLGFDPYKILTYKDSDVREKIALWKAKSETAEEAIDDSDKSKVYYKFMNSSQTKMFGYEDSFGKKHKGIENYIPTTQYLTTSHTEKVVEDILKNWSRFSHNGKFHAIFATNSINEAINYYKLIKNQNPSLKVTALFDPNIDNNENAIFKEEGLVEILKDYNKIFNQKFTIVTHSKFKKDVASRLSHKAPYKYIEKDASKKLDILIVVDQMLTGFDSKWVNTLYLDKVIEYENVIQAFSRTNRLFGEEKPFGIIRYYRKPHTMEKNIEEAVKLYSGNCPKELFVQKLGPNLFGMNDKFKELKTLFTLSDCSNFEKLPESDSGKGKFASLFKEMTSYLQSAKIQGFKWGTTEYSLEDDLNDELTSVDVGFDETTYLILAQRYKELALEKNIPDKPGIDPITFDIDGNLIEIDTSAIDSEYLNERFSKYLKSLDDSNINEDYKHILLDELHKSFATLTQEEQKYANIFLHDVQSGEAHLSENKTFKEYVTEYQFNAKNDQIYKISNAIGLDENKLRNLMASGVIESNINEFGRLDDLMKSVNKHKAKEFIESITEEKIRPFQVNVKINDLVKEFILKGGFDII